MHRLGTTCGETIGLQGPGGGNDQQKRQKLEHVYGERGVSVKRSMGDQGGEEWDGVGQAVEGHATRRALTYQS